MSAHPRRRTPLLVGLLCAAACSEPSSEPREPRGVLLISIDSLRADHLSCYGYRSATAPDVATSPNIDALLAEQGVLFESAVSTTSWTVPAHKALLTGLPDELHGGKTLGPLPRSRPLLAERFAAHGWRTAGFFSGPNLNPWYGFGRGFERYVDCSNAPTGDAEFFALETPEQREAMSEAQRASHQGVTGPKLEQAFDEWFAGIGADERFFAFVHMWDVHFDYAAPPEFDVFFPGYDGPVDGTSFWELDKQEERDPRDVQRLLALYDAEIRLTDHHVGRMLERLRAAGRLDDTLVVLVSDHGEEFFEHGRFGHNRTLFEEVVHVPLVMRWPPALPAGERVPDLVSLADVAPTVLELAGLPRSEPLWGRSLLSAVDASLPARTAPLDLRLFREENPLRAVRGDAYKLVRDGDAPLALYDLARDPGEHAPRVVGEALAADDPRATAARALWADLARERATLDRAGDVDDATMPAELLEQIRGVGYVEGEDPEGAPADGRKEEGE